mmetsp:Transcript_55144/g.165189  ORF Transcript_55144/g.165189 Transcript_55144/m.165189 type:complete len:370 (+) Transcript_55144:193-1302(+)
MQSSSMLKRRPPPQARRPHSPSGDRILPVHHERNDGDGKSRRRQKSRRRILFSNILRLTAVVVIALLLLVLAFDESLVYWSISSFPMESYQDRSDLVSLDNANTAVISIHEGFKYHGSLGRFLRENKRSYAITHGYAFVDTFPDEGDLLPLDPWQIDSKSAFHYKKMRFVLHEMEQYTNLEWILWVDSDTIFTQQHVGIEDRTDEFEALHSGLKSTADDLGNPSDICVVWAKDPLPDEGVLLFRNSVTARSMLRTSLQTDKASLTVSVEVPCLQEEQEPKTALSHLSPVQAAGLLQMHRNGEGSSPASAPLASHVHLPRPLQNASDASSAAASPRHATKPAGSASRKVTEESGVSLSMAVTYEVLQEEL